MKKFFLLILILSFLSLTAKVNALNSIPEGYGVASISVKNIDLVRPAGFIYVRTGETWANVEKKKGIYNWASYDAMINSIISKGLVPFIILGFNNPIYGAESVFTGITTTTQRNAFAMFAAEAVKRYRGRGIIWEIWNEPNIGYFWKPVTSPENYAALVKTTASAIRRVAPAEIVVAGSMATDNKVPFFTLCAKAGMLKYIDAVTMHPYRKTAPEVNLGLAYKQIRDIIKQYNPANPNIPIISSEWGYSTVWTGMNEAKQASYLQRSFLLNKYYGIPVSIWYDYRDNGTNPTNPEHHFGILRYDYSKKPAYSGASSLLALINKAKYIKRLNSAADDYILEFSGLPNGARYFLWTSAAPHYITLNNKKIYITNSVQMAK